MDEAWLVVFEGFLLGRRTAFLAYQVGQLGDAMPAQATAQTGTGDGRIDELPRDGQQVVRGQQQRRAQLDDDGFLRWRKRGAQGIGTVGAVFDAVALLPLADGLARDVVTTGQLGLRLSRFPDFLAAQVSGSGKAVQGLAHNACRD